MKAEKKTYFRYSILVRREGKKYASWCPELDVASSGGSIEIACSNLKDAIDCFVKTYYNLGELKQMLNERGIALSSEERCPSIFLSEARLGVPTIA